MGGSIYINTHPIPSCGWIRGGGSRAKDETMQALAQKEIGVSLVLKINWDTTGTL